MARASVKAGAGKIGSAAKRTADKARSAVKATADKAEAVLDDAHGPSPNPATNLIIADVALRGGGRLLRHVVERTILGIKYPPEETRQIVKSRGMIQSLVGTAVARVATRSVPGALLVGGGLLAKTLYDRSKTRAKARAEGEKAVDEQARRG
jgi:hypothetical protein